MNRWLESRIFWGVLLILGGVMFLLQNLGFFEIGGLFWSLLLGLAGVFFLSLFFQNRANWWALIPGFTLLSVAALIAVGYLFPRLSEALGGVIILGGIGLSFLVIYIVQRENWWAIIPAGVMLTLASISLLENVASLETPGIFFLGLGLTFALVALLPTNEGRQRWAWIPATVLLLMGMFIMLAAGQWIGYLWPVALILVGGYLILRTLRPQSQ